MKREKFINTKMVNTLMTQSLLKRCQYLIKGFYSMICKAKYYSREKKTDLLIKKVKLKLILRITPG